MALIYPYSDGYLAPLISQERETRALAEVAMLGTFPDDWSQRLVVLRTYVITCLESQKAPDDVFAAKLSAYRKEFDGALPAARAAQQAAEVATDGISLGTGSPFSITLERS